MPHRYKIRKVNGLWTVTHPRDGVIGAYATLGEAHVRATYGVTTDALALLAALGFVGKLGIPRQDTPTEPGTSFGGYL